jgi:hypothetical protein
MSAPLQSIAYLPSEEALCPSILTSRPLSTIIGNSRVKELDFNIKGNTHPSSLSFAISTSLELHYLLDYIQVRPFICLPIFGLSFLESIPYTLLPL